jgi:hypothetical protein
MRNTLGEASQIIIGWKPSQKNRLRSKKPPQTSS